jgi:uncharacterized protein YbaR (Trm112 family)
MPVSEELLSILVCPKCKGPLKPTADGSALDCTACKLRYPIEDGIPVLLIAEAEPLD